MITFVTFHIDCNQKAADYISKENILLDDKNDYLAMIEMLFQSASVFHPDCRKVVVTDRQTNLSRLSENVEIHRLDLNSETVMLSRLQGQIDYVKQHDFSSDLILLDSDMLINGKLNDLFEQDFHVGLTYRDTEEMPFNGGVIFISKVNQPQAVRFLEKVHSIYLEQYSKHSTWWGDQYALIDAVGEQNFLQRRSEQLCVDGIKISCVPCDVYNFSPENRYKAIIPELKNKKILHFKGHRKRLMRLYWNAYLRTQEFSGLHRLLQSGINQTTLVMIAFSAIFRSKLSIILNLFQRGKNKLLKVGSS